MAEPQYDYSDDVPWAWSPTSAEHAHLECVITMTTDCLMGRGCDSVATYAANLRRIADALCPHVETAREEEP